MKTTWERPQSMRRSCAPPQVEGAKGDEKSAATFEFGMEELYRKLFQAEESRERERELNALYKECGRYVRHTQPTTLSRECGRLKMQHPSTGVGSFDIRTRQVLWKYAAMAWQDGWPTARASAGNAESEDDEEVYRSSTSSLERACSHLLPQRRGADER